MCFQLFSVWQVKCAGRYVVYRRQLVVRPRQISCDSGSFRRLVLRRGIGKRGLTRARRPEKLLENPGVFRTGRHGRVGMIAWPKLARARYRLRNISGQIRRGRWCVKLLSLIATRIGVFGYLLFLSILFEGTK